MRHLSYLAAMSLALAAGNLATARAQDVVDPFGAPKQKAAAKTPRPEAPPVDAAAQRLKSELNKQTNIEFVEQPLKDVVLYLAEQHGIPIYLRAKKLEEAGVATDHPITINLKGLRLSTALDLILSDLELTYIEKDGLLIITTPEEAQNTLVVQVFNCRDLLAEKSPALAAKKAGEANDDADEGFGGAAPAQAPLENPRAKRLMELLTTNVHQQSWMQAGGPGTISEYDGLIVVTQTAETQREVERTLDMLREAAGLEIPRSGKVVR